MAPKRRITNILTTKKKALAGMPLEKKSQDSSKLVPKISNMLAEKSPKRRLVDAKTKMVK